MTDFADAPQSIFDDVSRCRIYFGTFLNRRLWGETGSKCLKTRKNDFADDFADEKISNVSQNLKVVNVNLYLKWGFLMFLHSKCGANLAAIFNTDFADADFAKFHKQYMMRKWISTF